ncbi:MAG: peptide chain release factor N(5)-glutamine methyltransferase [Pseudothermotoga sp.]
MTFRELYTTSKTLISNASDSSGTEALLLLSHVTQLTKERVLLHFDDPVEDDVIRKVLDLAQLRADGFPLQYLVGKCYFYGLQLDIEQGVFIPRIETEVLVDIALEIVEEEGLKVVADIGTGSGAIAIAIALNSSCEVYVTDVNEKALALAQKNAEKFGAKVCFFKGAFLEPLKPVLNKIDLIVSNPPYIPKGAILPKEVLMEPSEALFAGEDGLEFYRNFFSQLDLLKGKTVLMEFSPEQEDEIEKFGVFGEVSFYQDQFGKIRFFQIKIK